MKLNPDARLALTMAAIVLLVVGVGQDRDLRIVLASLAGFFCLLWIAGGGRLPWRVGLRDYVFYVLISLVLVCAVILFAFHDVRKPLRSKEKLGSSVSR